MFRLSSRVRGQSVAGPGVGGHAKKRNLLLSRVFEWVHAGTATRNKLSTGTRPERWVVRPLLIIALAAIGAIQVSM